MRKLYKLNQVTNFLQIEYIITLVLLMVFEDYLIDYAGYYKYNLVSNIVGFATIGIIILNSVIWAVRTIHLKLEEEKYLKAKRIERNPFDIA